MIENSKNYEIWNAIKNNDLEKVESIIELVNNEYPETELPENHFLKSKNINGESCLMFAIKTKRYEIYDCLINLNPNWIPIDSILFEKCYDQPKLVDVCINRRN